jgi:type III secretory pathway component EscU
MEIVGIIIGGLISLILLALLVTYIFIMYAGYKFRKKGEGLIMKHMKDIIEQNKKN